jgi:DNA-3-methyladenine glycosylase
LRRADVVSQQVLPREFYARDPAIVAKALLGGRLLRKVDKSLVGGIIVETEAYYGLDDPASRAYHGMKDYNKAMWNEPGLAFIYNVHNNWMFNIVAHTPDHIGAVLVRAIQPTNGMEIMKRNRPGRDTVNLTTGPGKLTKALGITKSLNGVPVFSPMGEINVARNEIRFQIRSSRRIGVRKDLKRNLRFFIKDNEFVSR